MEPEAGIPETPTSKTGSENDDLTPKGGLTETNTGKTEGENIENERLIESKTPNKGGRPSKATSSTAVTWSVRGVERETRAFIEKAAERAGKTLGQYFNDEVRGFAQGQLSQAEATGQDVASPRDMQNQLDHLTAIVEGIATRIPEPQKQTVLWDVAARQYAGNFYVL